jgi:putative nucleotidyltransferase with HDIG domain
VDARVAARGDGDAALAYQRLQAAYQQTLRYADDVRRLHRGLQRAVAQSLRGLANALEAKDPYTCGHSERVALRSRELAAALALGPDVMEVVAQAGLLHDLGKIGVPEPVLRKQGRLDPDEWTLMRRHPTIGAQIIAPFEFLAEAAVYVRHHHERWDGTGYPDGLSATAIPLGARIIAVADVYDALTSDRPYRQALAPDAALHYLAAEAGATLDADIVEAFLGLTEAGAH